MSGLVSAEELAASSAIPRCASWTRRSCWTSRPTAARQITSGRAGYDAGHVPGAAFADLITDLSEPGSGLPFTVPSEERFAAAIAALGVGDDSRVVVYDQGATAWATRLWWLLRYFGFEDVRVLDGGQPAWEAAGGELSTEPASHPPAASFPPHPGRSCSRRRTTSSAATPTARACVVNALDEEELPRRAHPRHLAPRGRQPARPRDRPRPAPSRSCARTIAAVVPEDGPPPIAYCGGGIAATLDVFALALAGRDDAKLYDDSMTGWTADPARPVKTG